MPYIRRLLRYLQTSRRPIVFVGVQSNFIFSLLNFVVVIGV